MGRVPADGDDLVGGLDELVFVASEIARVEAGGAELAAYEDGGSVLARSGEIPQGVSASQVEQSMASGLTVSRVSATPSRC
ncbi:hypothetical protein DLJ59_31590 [Micromonospora inaquosa]|uniref:Uncharacterized protein n=1 Tax=Micromonospora inaquosa TaxID=2203716 RepID=A0A3N9W5L8_9ACTN|nr:hypothetical protein DLJ59_31590 [Micromonospora inaquosa]